MYIGASPNLAPPALAGIADASLPPRSPLRQADRGYKAAIANLTAQASIGIQAPRVTKEPVTSAPVVTRTQPKLARSVKSPRGKTTYSSDRLAAIRSFMTWSAVESAT